MEVLILCLQVAVLVCFSAICSGLNVSLLALDLGELQRKAKLGNRQAKRVLPLRRNSHLTLAAILLINVGAVSASSLVLEHHLNGVLAGIISTLLIVIFGEIFPQALLSKRALFYMSLATPVLRGMIFITYPIAKPLQLLLDRLFGQERRELQSRRELGMMISEHLPKMAQTADKIAIVRSLTSPEGSHERACHYMLTGNRILPTLEYPAYGSVVLREKGFRTKLPPYIAIPNTLRGGGAGYMGSMYQPFSTGDPGGQGNAGCSVRGGHRSGTGPPCRRSRRFLRPG